MTSPRPINLTIDPDPRLWRGMIEHRWGALNARARLFRHELGLPEDRPIVCAGHEPAFWHCGVIAKMHAIQCAARQAGGAPAWLVVDHAEPKFQTLRVPVRDDTGRLKAADVRLCPDAPPGIAAASMATFDPAGSVRGAPPGVAEGVERIFAALRARRGKTNAAMQVSGAMFDLLGEAARGVERITATSIARTSLMRELVEEMRRAPERALGAYNRVVGRFPESGVPPLRNEAGRWELPLWRLRDGLPRGRVWSDDASVDAELNQSAARGEHPPLCSKTHSVAASAAPRALLMTGMMRLAGCELFVHGLGGVRYDHATEAWFREWLGEELAPMTLVTADVFLPPGEGGATAADAARAMWRVHRARHDPALVGRMDLALRKREFVDRIARLRSAGEDAAGEYRAMHAMLAEYRSTEAVGLAAIEAEAERTLRRFEESRVLVDRTWAFPFLPAETLEALRQAVADRWRPGFEGGA